VRADVKDEVVFVAKGRRVAAMVIVLVVHYGRDALIVESVSGAEAGHSSSKDDDVSHLLYRAGSASGRAHRTALLAFE
jgi:hypothetical protein